MSKMNAAFGALLALIGVVAANPTVHFEADAIVFNDTTNEKSQNLLSQHAGVGDEKCLEILGCFIITKDFFHILYRPVNFLPQDRKRIGTQFLLYTHEYKKEIHMLHSDDPEDLLESPLNPEHPVIFIVHGFFDSRLYGKWMEKVKDELLMHGEYNVIIVDWSKGNGAPYTQAAANSRVVGAEIAHMIDKLKEAKGISPKNCYIIGHSLGAHIAGYAGQRLNGTLGRITGLDPAGPYFQNMPPTIRLDQKDADFVDVIHTDTSSLKFLALGMKQAIGHVDFFPNNGMSHPGCNAHNAIYSIFLEGLVDASRRFVACNHQRSIDFYLNSINHKKILPVAYQCMRWEDYVNGLCSDCGSNNNKCAIMGLRAIEYKPYKNDSTSFKFFIGTSGTAPFWEYMYQVTLKLKRPKTSFKDAKGEMVIRLESKKDNHDITLITKTYQLIHGATYSFLVKKEKPLININSATFSWKSTSWSFSKQEIYVEFIKISPMNVNYQKDQKNQSKMYCTMTEKTEAKKEVPLIDCK